MHFKMSCRTERTPSQLDHELAEHQYSIVHRSRRLHGDADALSHCPLTCNKTDSVEEDHLFVTTDQSPPDLEEFNREHFSIEQSLDHNIIRIRDEEQMQPNSPLHKTMLSRDSYTDVRNTNLCAAF